MRKKAPKTYDDDDGRTIVNMNVEGMPWYVSGDKERLEKLHSSERTTMTDEEARAYKHAALRAALLVALVFGVVFFLFIAFCDFIWFR